VPPIYCVSKRHNIKKKLLWRLVISSVAGADDRRLLLIDVQSPHQTSKALLEIAVLGGVDERVDAAVGENQNHGEVVEPVMR